MTSENATRISTLLILFANTLASCSGGSYGGGGGGRPPASLSFSVSPTTITLGEDATLTWNSNAPNCTATGAWNGSKPGSGSESVTPTETGTLTYVLVCSGGRYGESNQLSASLTVNPARQAMAWVGEACCVGTATFAVDGITNESGELRILARGRHVVARPGKPAIAFAACDACLVGARVDDPFAFALRAVTPRGRRSELAALEGHYMTHLGSGYTLTVSIDRAGRMTGIDTRGCRLDGQARAQNPKSAVFDVTLEVSACATSDGRYSGDAALLADWSGEPGGLLLSASNASAAIGWRLDR